MSKIIDYTISQDSLVKVKTSVIIPASLEYEIHNRTNELYAIVSVKGPGYKFNIVKWTLIKSTYIYAGSNVTLEQLLAAFESFIQQILNDLAIQINLSNDISLVTLDLDDYTFTI